MKVLLINGSQHENGCTYTALNEVASALQKQDIETEIFQLGKDAISGCGDCGVCFKTGRCFIDDKVNELLDKADKADGFIFGSPVYFASPSGALISFMDRLFYTNITNKLFHYKPAASIVSCRRGGASSALDQINKYFAVFNMPVVSSQLWNMIHGNTPEEVQQDLEGMQVMRTLGKNMAWLLKSIEAGKKSNLNLPEQEAPVFTNFIR